MPQNIDAATIKVDFKTDTRPLKEASQELDNFSDLAGSTAESLKSLSHKLIGLGAGLAGVFSGVGATYGVFQKEVQKTVGLVGLSQREADELGDKALDLSTKYGIAVQTIQEAGFTLASAGQRGTTLFESLEAATKGAAAGLGETGDVAIGAAKAMQVWGDEGLTATDAISGMIEVAKIGLLDASELSGTFASIGNNLKSMNVSFQEAGGILAYMSLAMGSVSEAGTALSQLTIELKKPRGALKELAEQYGITVDVMVQKIKDHGLHATVNELHQLSGKSAEAFSGFFGSKESQTAVIQMIGKHKDAMKGFIEQTADSEGELEAAFKAVKDTLSTSYGAMTKSLKTFAVTVGETLAPSMKVILDMTTAIIKFGQSLFKQVPYFKTLTQVMFWMTPIVIALGVALLGLSKAMVLLEVKKGANVGWMKAATTALWGKFRALKADTAATMENSAAQIAATNSSRRFAVALQRVKTIATRFSFTSLLVGFTGVIAVIGVVVEMIKAVVNHVNQARNRLKDFKEELGNIGQDVKESVEDAVAPGLIRLSIEITGDKEKALTSQGVEELLSDSESYEYLKTVDLFEGDIDLVKDFLPAQERKKLEDLLEYQQMRLEHVQEVNSIQERINAILERNEGGTMHYVDRQLIADLESEQRFLTDKISLIDDANIDDNIQALRVVASGNRESMIDELRQNLKLDKSAIEDIYLEEISDLRKTLAELQQPIAAGEIEVYGLDLRVKEAEKERERQLESLHQNLILTHKLREAQHELRQVMRPLSDLDREIDSVNRLQAQYEQLNKLLLNVEHARRPLTEIDAEIQKNELLFQLEDARRKRELEAIGKEIKELIDLESAWHNLRMAMRSPSESERLVQSINAETEAYNRQADAIRGVNRAHQGRRQLDPEARANEILAELIGLETSLMEDQTAIRNLIEQTTDPGRLIYLHKLLDANKQRHQDNFQIIEDDAEEHYDYMEESFHDEYNRFADQMAMYAGQALDQFTSVIMGDTSVADAFENLGRMALNALSDVLSQKAMAKIFGNAVSGMSIGGGGGGSPMGAVAGLGTKYVAGSNLAASGTATAVGGAGAAIGKAGGILGALGGPIGLGIMGALSIGSIFLGAARRRRARERARREQQRQQMDAMIEAVKADCEEKPWLGERVRNSTLGFQMAESMKASTAASTAALNMMANNAVAAIQANANLNTAVQALTNPASMQYQRLHLGGPGQSSITNRSQDTHIQKVEISIDGAKDAKRIAEDVHRALSTHEWENAGNVFYSQQRL